MKGNYFILYIYIVKPLYNGQPWEIKKCPLQGGAVRKKLLSTYKNIGYMHTH